MAAAVLCTLHMPGLPWGDKASAAAAALPSSDAPPSLARSLPQSPRRASRPPCPQPPPAPAASSCLSSTPSPSPPVASPVSFLGRGRRLWCPCAARARVAWSLWRRADGRTDSAPSLSLSLCCPVRHTTDDPSRKKLGAFLVQSQLQGSVNSSAMFLTAAAQARSAGFGLCGQLAWLVPEPSAAALRAAICAR